MLDSFIENVHIKTINFERNPSTLLVGLWTSTITMKISMDIPQNLKIEIPFDPTLPDLGIFPRELKTLYYDVICIYMFRTMQLIVAG